MLVNDVIRAVQMGVASEVGSTGSTSMMSRKEANPKEHPLELLFVGMPEQCAVLRECLGVHRQAGETNIDHALDIGEAKEKLSHKMYDLLVCAQRGADPEAAQIIHELRLQERKVPVLFLGVSVIRTSS